jgi:hypothetical protein
MHGEHAGPCMVNMVTSTCMHFYRITLWSSHISFYFINWIKNRSCLLPFYFLEVAGEREREREREKFGRHDTHHNDI